MTECGAMKAFFYKHTGIISINISLFLFMLLTLWIKPVDGLRKYNIYSHPGETEEVILPVYGDRSVTQFFICSDKSDSFEIFFSPVNQEYHGSFKVSLLNETGEIIEEWNTDKLDTADGWVQYRLKNASIEPGQKYRLVVTAPDLDEFGAIGVSAFISPEGIDGADDLLYEGSSDGDHNGMTMSFGVYRHMINVFAIAAFICLFAGVNVCYVLRNKGTEKFALPVLITSGLIMLFILAPGCGPDDIYHYYSSIGLSNKLLLRDDINVIEKKYESDLPIHHNTNTALVETFEGLRYRVGTEEGTYIYEGRMDKLKWPLSHLAQAVGITIGRLLKLGFIRVYTLGRLFNMAAYIALALLAIRLVPVNKELMLMLAILPMSMQQATQLSYDAPVNGLALVFTGYIFRILYEKKEFKWKETIICALLITAISPLKVIYILLGILLLLIPGAQFKSLFDRMTKIGMIVLCGVIVLVVTRSSDVSASAVRSASGLTSNLSSMEVGHYTIRFVFSEPIRFIKLVLLNWGIHFSNMFRGMIGGSLAGFSISIPEQFVMIFALSLVLCALADTESVISKKWQMIITLGLPLLGYLAVLIVFAFAETTYGTTYIGGLQGRYMIPFLFPALYSMCGRKIHVGINRTTLFIPVAFVELIYIVEVMSSIDF